MPFLQPLPFFAFGIVHFFKEPLLLPTCTRVPLRPASHSLRIEKKCSFLPFSPSKGRERGIPQFAGLCVHVCMLNQASGHCLRRRHRALDRCPREVREEKRPNSLSMANQPCKERDKKEERRRKKVPLYLNQPSSYSSKKAKRRALCPPPLSGFPLAWVAPPPPPLAKPLLLFPTVQ